jgi:uncharacterized protein (DUF58 family)
VAIAAPDPSSSALPSVANALDSPTRDGRFDAYLWLAIGGLVLAMVRGRSEPAVLAAPFLLALLVGARGSRRLEFGDSVINLDDTQVVVGREVHGTIVIDRPSALALEVMLPSSRAFETGGEPLSWRVPAGTGPVRLPFTMTTHVWGNHTIGPLIVRARRPGGLYRWEGGIGGENVVRVLPATEQLSRLLSPRSSRASWGVHRSRVVGSGSEFAEVRPYQPGDRMRDLNWRATARVRKPHVNRHHVERAGEVVLLIDTSADAIADASNLGQEALARGARAAWAVANVHLKAHDRVGLLTHGRVSTWLAPDSGNRARHQLLGTLLAVGADAAANRRTVSGTPERLVPPDALVVGLSPLWDGRLVTMLQSLRAKGRNVTMIVIDMSDQLPSETIEQQWSQRLFQQLVEARLAALERSGIPTVRWRTGEPIGGVVRQLQMAGSRNSVGAAR